MNKLTIYALLGLAIFLVTAVGAQAKRFHKNGYEVEILWKQKGSKQLQVWGKITGGKKSCEQLNYDISFKNSETGSYARVCGFIENYRPNGRNRFTAEDTIHSNNHRKKWYVKKYTMDCLN